MTVADGSLPLNKKGMDKSYHIENSWAATQRYEKIIRYQEILRVL
jgi:hypothetical protein